MPRNKRASVSKAKATTKKPKAKAAAKPVKKLVRGTTAPAQLRQPAPTPGPAGPYLGQIRLLAYNFAPQGWAPCNGQLLAIPQNVPLFQLIGKTYGGNGSSTFALPNLPPRGPSGPYYYIALAGALPPH
jgi:hypothetical protein